MKEVKGFLNIFLLRKVNCRQVLCRGGRTKTYRQTLATRSAPWPRDTNIGPSPQPRLIICYKPVVLNLGSIFESLIMGSFSQILRLGTTPQTNETRPWFLWLSKKPFLSSLCDSHVWPVLRATEADASTVVCQALCPQPTVACSSLPLGY